MKARDSRSERNRLLQFRFGPWKILLRYINMAQLFVDRRIVGREVESPIEILQGFVGLVLSGEQFTEVQKRLCIGGRRSLPLDRSLERGLRLIEIIQLPPSETNIVFGFYVFGMQCQSPLEACDCAAVVVLIEFCSAQQVV